MRDTLRDCEKTGSYTDGQTVRKMDGEKDDMVDKQTDRQLYRQQIQIQQQLDGWIDI